MFLSKFVFLSAIGVVAVVAYECCPCSNTFSGYCANGDACGTFNPPNYCCGSVWRTTCNYFCCDCYGGCKTGPGKNDSEASSALSNNLKILDKDSSGYLDLKEFDDFNTKNNIPKEVLVHTVFQLIDENGDGRISANELNTANKPKRAGHSEL